MKKIKEEPIGIKDYYKELRIDYDKKLEEAKQSLEKEYSLNVQYYEKLKGFVAFYKRDYKIDLSSYEEFTSNKYITGELLNTIKTFYRNASNPTVVHHAIELVNYGKNIENIYILEKNIKMYETILKFTYVEFKRYIQTFYKEVQRQMIVNGYAYKFEGKIGAVCINRCKVGKTRKLIDTKATKKRIEELKSKGIEIYDAAKAEYYKKHNLEYNGVDPKVYIQKEYCYEVPLLYSGLPHSYNYKFTPVDYWSPANRGKTKEDFIKEANGNLAYICNLDITFLTKVSICTEIDDTLYLKFIRNENQLSITSTKGRREGGQ